MEDTDAGTEAVRHRNRARQLRNIQVGCGTIRHTQAQAFKHTEIRPTRSKPLLLALVPLALRLADRALDNGPVSVLEPNVGD